MAMTTAPDVLALAAFEPELEALRAAIDPGGAIGALTVATSTVGIGVVAAALGAAAVLERLRPRAVLLLGTCGAYPGAPLEVGDVVVARGVRLVEPWACTGAAEFPALVVTTRDADEALTLGLAEAGARPLDVATTLAITVEDAAAALLAQATRAHVEHLEAFAVAAACRRVPFAAVLGVANVVGARARDQWRTHHRAAAAAAAACAIGWLRTGARGIAARPHVAAASGGEEDD